MSRLRLFIAFAVVFAIALVVAAPMSVGLAAAGLGEGALTARSVSGSVWAGRLEGSAFGPVNIGEVRAGLSPLSLLTGSPTLGFEARKGDAAGRGRVAVSGRRVAVSRLSGTAPLSAIGAGAGALQADGVAFAFRDGQCASASGAVAAQIPGFGGAPLALSGQPVCRGAQLVFPLSGGREGLTVESVFRIDAARRFANETRIMTDDPAIGALLSADGYTPMAGGWIKTVEGVL